MSDKKKFSEFVKENLIPAHAVTPEVEDELADVERKYPVLFASIHHQSPERPDGLTDKDMWEMNLYGNDHLPDLQHSMIDDHEQNGHDVGEYRKYMTDRGHPKKEV